MSPVVEIPPKRTFTIRFKDGSTQNIVAETICKPHASHDAFYRLKKGGELVAEYAAGDVSGWCIAEDEG